MNNQAGKTVMCIELMMFMCSRYYEREHRENRENREQNEQNEHREEHEQPQW